MSEGRDRVLIVDDEPLNRGLLRRMLEGGYEIAEAEDVVQALEVLEAPGGTAVALILCDHLMPGRTGAQLAHIVRERWPHIPFLLLTGFDGDAEVVAARESGVVREVIGKPWRGRDLKNKIAGILSGS